MSRIISYPYDSNVVDDDAWIGTEASTTRTKQYTASAVADYLNINGKISIGGQLAYQYVSDPLQAAGTFSITSGGLDNVLFANITALTLSMTDKGGQNVVAFLNYLVGSDILISKQNEISSFGHYEVVSYNVNPNDSQFYDLVVVFKGGNGSMNFLDFYDAINFTLASEIVGSYTFNVDSDNGVPFTVQNNDTIDFTSTNITVSNVNSAISFNLPVTGVTAGAYTAANITVDSFGRITDAADGASGPGGTGTTNFVTKWVNATTLGDSVIFDNGTNVGIGTTNPTTALHIKNDFPTIRLEDNTSGDNHFLTGNNGELRVQSTGFITMRPDNTISTTFLANGNVGIGTTSPGQKLQVVSDSIIMADFTTTSTKGGIRIAEADEGGLLSTEANRICLGSAIGVSANNLTYHMGTNKLGIGTASPINKLDVLDSSDTYVARFRGASATYVQSGDATLSGESGFLARNSTGQFFMNVAGGVAALTGTSGANTMTFGVGGAEKMRIASTGNVGIGTTSPSAKLEIQKGSSGVTSVNSQADALFLQNSSSTGITIATPDANKSSIFFSSASRQIGARINWGYNDLLMTLGTATANASLALKSGNESEAVRILSNGNVGIGTTSPSSKLHVEGTLQVIETNPITAEPNSSRIIAAIDSRGGTDSGGLGIYTGDTNNDEPALLITNYLDAEKFRILGASGDIRSAGLIRSTAYGSGNVTGTAAYNLSVDSNGNIIETTAGGGGSSNWTLTGNDIYNNNSGNVGIGTTSPNATLDIENSTGVTVDINSSSGDGQFRFQDNGITKWAVGRDNTQQDFVFSSSAGLSTDPVVVLSHSTGNVGIGTVGPHRKLTVTGAAGSAPLLALKNTSTSTANDVSLSFIRDNDDSKGFTIGINSANDAFNIAKSGSIVSTDVKLTIADDGNVGIGTTSPQAKLHVDGAIKIGTAQTLAASSTTVGAIRYRATTGASYMEMVMQTGVSGGIPVFAWVIIKQNTW